MATNKCLVATRVVLVDNKEIWNGAKLYDPSTSVQVVITAGIDKAAASEKRSLVFVSAASETSQQLRNTELDNDDLPELLRNDNGLFLKVAVQSSGSEGSAPRSLPSATQRITAAQLRLGRSIDRFPLATFVTLVRSTSYLSETCVVGGVLAPRPYLGCVNMRVLGQGPLCFFLP